MKQIDVKTIIVRRWLDRPEEERTESEAALFAMQVKDEFNFRCSGDKYQVIKGC